MQVIVDRAIDWKVERLHKRTPHHITIIKTTSPCSHAYYRNTKLVNELNVELN